MLCLRIVMRNNYSIRLNLFFTRARFIRWVVGLYLSNSKVCYIKLLIDTTWWTFLEKDWKHCFREFQKIYLVSSYLLLLSVLAVRMKTLSSCRARSSDKLPTVSLFNDRRKEGYQMTNALYSYRNGKWFSQTGQVLISESLALPLLSNYPTFPAVNFPGASEPWSISQLV